MARTKQTGTKGASGPKTKRAAKEDRSSLVATATKEEHVALAKHEARLRALLAKGEALAWDAGMELDRIASKGLHHAAGFATLEAYVDARFPQGFRTLKRYRRIATQFTKATVRKYGATKLDLGLTYIELTPEQETPMELLRLEVRVPSPKGTSSTLVPFPKATALQLERAIEGARRKPDAHDDVATARAKRVRDVVQAVVAAPKGAPRHAPLVRVYPHPEKTGAVRIDVVSIDVDDLSRVGRAIASVATKVDKLGGGPAPPRGKRGHAIRRSA